jgi:hypothetical protein
LNPAQPEPGEQNTVPGGRLATRFLRRPAVREWVGGAVVAIVLAVAGQLYLAPASDLMWARDRTHMMSNGGDATTLPFIYDVILRAAKASPRNLLYGSIYNPRFGPPSGSGMWVPWIERWLVVGFGRVLPIEQIPTAFVWVLMVLAGLSFYIFARIERWPWLLAFSFALAYAFNPYTRARAVVHDALVGIYCLPLIFAALCYLKRGGTVKRVAISAALLLFSVCTAHYYILMLIVISPVFLWFQLRDDGELPPRAAAWHARSLRLAQLALAAAPALIFLALNFLHPLAANAPHTRAAVPDPALGASYLRTYAARPIDYFADDVALGPRDPNPLRQSVNEAVMENNFDGSNGWERSNGIRWSILFPFLGLTLALCVPRLRHRLRPKLQAASFRKLTYFCGFAGVTFWLSLSPHSLSVYAHDLGPASWVNALFPEFRVPSRFGPFVHFAVLSAVGTFVSEYWPRVFSAAAPWWRRGLAGAVPLLIVLYFPPLNPVAIDRTYPPRLDLVAAGGGKCGVGVHFPYSAGSGSSDEAEMYPAFQQLRDTNCYTLQQPLPTELHQRMVDRIGNHLFDKAQKSARRAAAFQSRFVRFAQCARLEWVIFRAKTPDAWRDAICAELGWVRFAPDACGSPEPRASSFADPAPTCMPILESD